MMKEPNIHLGYFDPNEGHVSNPGMGQIGYVFSDHQHTRLSRRGWVWSESQDNNRPLDRKSFEEFIKLPYVDMFYIRLEWCDIHKGPGKLELTKEFHWMLEAAEKYNKRWSFRVMNSSPHSRFETSVPEFLLDRMEYETYWYPSIKLQPWPKKIPKYTEEYFKWWGELVNLTAEQFDSHPLLEFAEISGFGHWGEAHHYSSYTGPEGPTFNKDPENVEEVVDRIITQYLDAFKQTPVVMNMHFTEYEAGMKHLEESGVWLRRDSFMPNFSTYEWENIFDLKPGQAMMWEPFMPVLEGRASAPPVNDKSIMYRYKDSRACYSSLGFNAWDALLLHQYKTEEIKYLASVLGYKIRPSIVWRRYLENGGQQIALALVNDGCAAPPGTIKLTALFPSGKEVECVLEIGEPAPNASPIARFDIPKEDEGADSRTMIKIKAEIKLKEKSYRVQWSTMQYLKDPYLIELPLYQQSDLSCEIVLPGTNASGYDLRFDRDGRRVEE